MNYNYEERKYRIVTSIVISLLILSIVGVSLLLFLPRTPSNTLNTVNVGSRITGSFKSNLENASVWDGTSTTDWTGSGTESDPYLITKASQLAGMADEVDGGNSYLGKYFKLVVDIDMQSLTYNPIGKAEANWDCSDAITSPFSGNFDGDNHHIVNLANVLFNVVENATIKNLNLNINISSSINVSLYTPIKSVGNNVWNRYFGALIAKASESKISNINLEIENIDAVFYHEINYGSLEKFIYCNFGSVVGNAINCEIYACNVNYNNQIKLSVGCRSASLCFGGVVGKDENSTISKCNVADINLAFEVLQAKTNISSVMLGGMIGDATQTDISNCYFGEKLNIVYTGYIYSNLNDHTIAKECLGGMVGSLQSGTIANCFANYSYNTRVRHSSCRGGVVGEVASLSNVTITNNLFQGNIVCYNSDVSTGYDKGCLGGIIGRVLAYCEWVEDLQYVDTDEDGNEIYEDNGYYQLNVPNSYWWTGGVVNGCNVACYNNISNAIITYETNGDSCYWNFGGFTIFAGEENLIKVETIGNNYYNQSSFPANTTYGATTDANMKLRSTYASWTDFDTYWIINPKINNGYPMLRAFVDVAKVTGFDGSGTEADPYLIKTHQDLLGMASYYNDNTLFEKTNIYWKLANNIDVSVDANGLPIHFTPICYNKEFDGYFDGNGKTISGLLIDNQYSYTGLFGTIGANHYVKDLTVSGNIYWDQAYAVGGVAGRVMTGGYLQNCTFNGNIIGVLNTKTSTECHGVVGNYGIGGAIDCSATYKDIKYAKIGGTTDSPTYTYYLYDWAQINTNLYNRQVS